MTEQFRNHLENYPVAEVLGVNVIELQKQNKGFIVIIDNNSQFRARSIIYCAGKEYRRLGVPGEERFIGKGIGFCATCDAPIYTNKRVAVVGGGNSAFTAIRDLLNYASEVHLIHRRKEFTADATLVQEVLASKKFIVHTPMILGSFLGKDRLIGIRLETVEGNKKFDLNIDGVFLEIGLTPNTSPLKRLVELNQWDEIPINPDQSTTLEGLFAAGDVTDIREKQISIAVGQGALAALSVHRYLVQNKLTKTKIKLKETWQ